MIARIFSNKVGESLDSEDKDNFRIKKPLQQLCIGGFQHLSFIIPLIVSKIFNKIFFVERELYARRYHKTIKSKKQKKKNILIYLIVSSFTMAIYTLMDVFSYNLQNRIEFRLLFVLYTIFCSMVFLKEKLLKHNKVGIVTASIGLIILIISFFLFDKKNYTTREYVLQIISYFFYSVDITLIKRLFDNYYVDPNIFSVLHGFLVYIFLLIFFIVPIAVFENSPGNYIKENFEYLFTIHNNKDFYLYLSLMWLFAFPFEITKITTVYYFTPNLFVTTDILSPIFQWIIDIFIKKIKKHLM
jgi:lipid-A-disaccharide synthase-like uncharacterized protein